MNADTLKLSNVARVKMKYVLRGEVESLKVKIGSPDTLITVCYGKPIENGWFAGGYYYKYKDIVIFTSEGRVTSINLVKKGSLIAGIRIGTRLQEIIKILGPPTYYGFISEADGEEIYPDTWIVEYVIGDYVLFFAADKKNGKSVSGELRVNFNKHK